MSEDYVFHLDELALSVPGGFRDASTQALEWSAPEGRLGLIIQRELLAGEKKDLETLFQEVKRQCATRLPTYREEAGEERGTVAGLPTRHHRYRFKHQHAVVYQHQVMLMLDDRVITLTAAGVASQRDAVDELVERATSDVRIRER